ncbi:hypothetical protein Asulf_02019 [Archaeoglobus sulfaticallidus PM70-1]|uniref:Copper resistance protein D domain-containing protein n=1 Tax=Archaeoglobus sulfaticallidus PM70-1 TaxID=387631 RepID=N0BEE5_9EURY|nr:CopD family protein [Archaeoglobus sulfaticallidus]AGK61984.1 hypothetical protein Asulf_02019 [Archaeoglobus sulfaticallidus PM70-1]
MANPIVYGLVKGTHDLATAIWIGGLIQLSFVVFPAFKAKMGQGNELKPLLMDVQKRLSMLVMVSIPILIVTGILEAWHSQSFEGFFSFENTYSSLLSIKHILVILMIGIVIVRRLIMRSLNREIMQMQKMQKKKMMQAERAERGTKEGIKGVGENKPPKAAQGIQGQMPHAQISQSIKSKEKASMMLVFVNAIIGISVVILSGFCAAMGG